MSADGHLRPIFREHLRVGFDWTSVETGGTGRGVPDSNYCAMVPAVGVCQCRNHSGTPGGACPCGETFTHDQDARSAEGWVEFKQTSGWACTLRPEQVGWLVRRHMHGGRVFVATRRWHDGHSRADATDELWLHDGRLARELKTDGLRGTDPLGVWHGGPSAWDWDEIRRLLCS